jgi:hypothetical protein
MLRLRWLTTDMRLCTSFRGKLGSSATGTLPRRSAPACTPAFNSLRKNAFGLSFRGVRHSYWRTTRNLALS